jgi:hypothetical protein
VIYRSSDGACVARNGRYDSVINQTGAEMNQATTIAIRYNGELVAFRLVPLTDVREFLENVELLTKPSDVRLGEEMGWWRVAA